MSKPAALLLALALSAGACSTSEPEQSIVAIAEPAAASDDAGDKSTNSLAQTDTESPTTTEAPLKEAPTETTVARTEAPVKETPTETAVEALLASTVDPDRQHASARFRGGIEMSGNAEGESIDFEIELRGAYDIDAEAMELTLDMSSMAQMLGDVDPAEAAQFEEIFADPLQMRAIGDTAWLKWGLLDMFSGSEGSWIEMESDENMFGSAASTPTDLVELFKGASGQVTDLGATQINGVDTTHYQILIDMEAYAGELSAAEAAELRGVVGELGDMPLDVWVDADGLLRRLEMAMSSEALGASGLNPGDNFEMSVWYEVLDYGSDIVITAPPADEVISGSEFGTF